MFALIANSSVIQVDATTFPVNAAFVWVDVSGISPPPEVGWEAAQSGNAWTFTAPSASSVDTRPAAMAALDISDRTIVRCYEHGIAVPADWIAYRAALRAIVSGSATDTTLPTAPAYPAGS